MKSSCLPQHDRQRPKDMVVVGKYWNNQFCYNRLILGKSIKITQIKIMRWETEKSGYINDAMMTQSLNTKLLLTRKAK